jgi:hypothetical protein
VRQIAGLPQDGDPEAGMPLSELLEPSKFVANRLVANP